MGIAGLLQLFFEQVVQFIANLGYWGIGVGMALESACIPIPSEIILPFGGYLVSTGQINFWGAVMAGTVGGTAGSLVAYFIGITGGRPFIIKYGKYFFVSQRDLQKAEYWFARHGEATAFLSRLLPIVRTFISLPCGIAKMNFSKFVAYTFLGSLPWSIALVYAGAKLGDNWPKIRVWFHQADILIGFGLIVTIIIYVGKHINLKSR